MRISYKVEIRPSPGQLRSLLQAAGNRRWTWNWALARKEEEYEKTGRSPSYVDLGKEITKLKRVSVENGGANFLSKTSKCVHTEALRDLDQAYKMAFKRIKKGENPGFPKRRNRNRGIGGFKVQCLQVKEDNLKIPKLGRVRLMPGEKGYIPVGKYPGVSSIIEEKGKWFVVVTSPEIPEAKPNDQISSVGLDMGVVNLATLSDGTTIENPRFLEKNLDKIKRFQRDLSRKKKGSSNRAKAKLRLGRIHMKVKNQRRNYLHGITKNLAKSHGRIAIEDLSVQRMIGTAKSKVLKRSLGNASLYEFRRQLEYKGKLYGCEITVVPAFFTSQKCSQCGFTDEGNRFSQSSFVCLRCGHGMNADLNAAINIKVAAKFPETINACGGNVNPDQIRLCPLKQESTQEVE